MNTTKVSNSFIAAGETHHKAMHQHHSDLSEHHAAIAEHHAANDNPSLHKLHARIARCHAAIAACHKSRGEAYANAASGLDEESRSFLHQAADGAADLHRAADDEIDPELRDLVE